MAPDSSWSRRNLRVLAVFGPVLIAAGILGFVVPEDRGLMSGAAPYNVFHIASGLLGLTIVSAKHARAAAAFNFAFGLFDLYQAAAGVIRIFPAQTFELRPADHIVHVAFGVVLITVGSLGLLRK